MNKRIKIIEYTKANSLAIKTLNYEWLEKYFKVEEGDVISLSNPQEEIIEKGGFIFYATLDDEIIGTSALVRITDTVFEISKMAVTEKSQGLGVGKLIIEHCLAYAKEKRFESLIIYSNTSLKPAIHLYKKFGFNEIDMEEGVYERANIKMELHL